MKIIQSVVLLLTMMMGMAAWAGPININTADSQSMAQVISGVGEKRAQAIVDYRTQNGPFKTVDGLANVKGIGTAIVEKNRENLTVGN